MEIGLKQDPVNEAAFLQKYGGLMRLDPDTNKKFMASRKIMHWNPMCGEGKCYCLKGLNDGHNPTNPDNEDWEPWILKVDLLHSLIVGYYKSHPEDNQMVVTVEEKERLVEQEELSVDDN